MAAPGGTQRIAGYYADSTTSPFLGRIAGVIAYNSALGGTDRSTNYAHLNDKYGFTL